MVHTMTPTSSTAEAERKRHHRPAATPSSVPPTAATTDWPTSTAAMSACENTPYIHSGASTGGGVNPYKSTNHSEAIRAGTTAVKHSVAVRAVLDVGEASTSSSARWNERV